MSYLKKMLTYRSSVLYQRLFFESSNILSNRAIRLNHRLDLILNSKENCERRRIVFLLLFCVRRQNIERYVWHYILINLRNLLPSLTRNQESQLKEKKTNKQNNKPER